MEKTMLNIDITYDIDQIENFFDDEKIKELALHQLEKRKRLGRWEQKMNDD